MINIGCWNIHGLNGPTKHMEGSKQFQVCKKLKLIKQQLKRLNKDHVGNVYDVVIKSKADLDMCQRLLDSNPFHNSLRAQEKIIYDAYVSVLIVEEMFLRQKSRVQWLKAGDKNSSFFFKSISKNRSCNKQRVQKELKKVFIILCH
ncbi:uncharacterized protein LOC126600867 isoform X2 [Malus sylvestris]|uniref:uncharacterized protein LOC126600867 isoform X2 n=1 Tax=Malus sylvestris TaxID=3752 RepID=UPI0021ACD490|nr:uncharacterized protein LOC126600867 isoform X2 [Malus sylvestris]